MNPLKISTIALVPLLLSLAITPEAQPTYIYHICSNTTTFIRNSAYGNNLVAVLNSLSTNTNRQNGFYDFTAGNDPDDVHGLFFCSGAFNATVCKDCVSFATQDIVQRCPNQTMAIIWYDECLLRYSSQKINSVMDTSPAVYMWNTQNITDPERFNELLGKTMGGTVTDASTSQTGASKFAVKDANFTERTNIYTLAQCTPDLSGVDCNRCLEEARSQLSVWCNGKQGGRILSPSCNIRYEIYPFYNVTGYRREVYPYYNTTVVGGFPTSPPIPPIAPTAAPSPTRPQERNKASQIKVIASVSASIIGVFLFSFCIYTLWKRKFEKKAEENEISQEVQLLNLGRPKLGDHHSGKDIHGEMPINSQDFPYFSFDTVYEATKHFSDENKLGEGGFGPVYKGTLEDGKEIAVKRLSRTSSQGLQEFMAEVTLIARLQHRNLVRLLGCCLEKTEKLLIYEYMPNKSLDVFLFDSNMGIYLDWKRRLNIINGVARGILYLHEDSRLRVIHRDLKASNVLLDDEMNPKISDFGMARIFGGNDNNNTNRVVGTYGYMSPEYAMEGLFSVKSDVFSFGVLLLEIISGKRNNRFYLSEEGESLLTYAWKLWSKGEGLELMDPSLVQSSVAADVLKCVHIGLLCVQDDPTERPTMSSVVVMLGSDAITLPKPKHSAFSIVQFVARSATSEVLKASVNEVTLSNVSPR